MYFITSKNLSMYNKSIKLRMVNFEINHLYSHYNNHVTKITIKFNPGYLQGEKGNES